VPAASAGADLPAEVFDEAAMFKWDFVWKNQ
jgi:hypothetical protein